MTELTPKDLRAWPKAIATVLSCHYEFGAGRALAFGAPSDKHFRITFNYWANDQIHNGQFFSEKAVPQGTLFPVTYNPQAPHEHTHSGTSASRSPIIAVGLIGSLVLTTVWFFILHGCR